MTRTGTAGTGTTRAGLGWGQETGNPLENQLAMLQNCHVLHFHSKLSCPPPRRRAQTPPDEILGPALHFVKPEHKTLEVHHACIHFVFSPPARCLFTHTDTRVQCSAVCLHCSIKIRRPVASRLTSLAKHCHTITAKSLSVQIDSSPSIQRDSGGYCLLPSLIIPPVPKKSFAAPVEFLVVLLLNWPHPRVCSSEPNPGSTPGSSTRLHQLSETMSRNVWTRTFQCWSLLFVQPVLRNPDTHPPTPA